MRVANILPEKRQEGSSCIDEQERPAGAENTGLQRLEVGNIHYINIPFKKNVMQVLPEVVIFQ